jgi:hypothetical protein
MKKTGGILHKPSQPVYLDPKQISQQYYSMSIDTLMTEGDETHAQPSKTLLRGHIPPMRGDVEVLAASF